MKKSVGIFLKERRIAAGYKQETAAKALDLDSETISRLERSSKLPKKGDSARRMLELYGSSMKELSQWLGEPAGKLPGNFTIPRVGSITAGNAREYEIDQMAEEGVPGALYPYPTRSPMVLRVVGDSMVSPQAGIQSIYDGDDVIFANEFNEVIPEGAIVIARLPDGATTVKRVHYIDKNNLELVPQNPQWDPQPYVRSDVQLRRVKVIVNYPYKRHADG